MKLILKTVIDPNRFEINYLKLRPNHITSNDGFFANLFNMNLYRFFEAVPLERNSEVRP